MNFFSLFKKKSVRAPKIVSAKDLLNRKPKQYQGKKPKVLQPCYPKIVLQKCVRAHICMGVSVTV